MNRTDNKSFYNPVDAGIFDLGITQVDKVIPFASTAGVFIAEAKVDFFSSNRIVKTATIGSGLVIVGTNTAGISKTLELTLQGADFSKYCNQHLQAKCTLFTDGDIEVIFDLKIIG